MTPAVYTAISAGCLAVSLGAVAFSWSLLRRSRQADRLVNAIIEVEAQLRLGNDHAFVANKLTAQGLTPHPRSPDAMQLLADAYGPGPLADDAPSHPIATHPVTTHQENVP